MPPGASPRTGARRTRRRQGCRPRAATSAVRSPRPRRPRPPERPRDSKSGSESPDSEVNTAYGANRTTAKAIRPPHVEANSRTADNPTSAAVPSTAAELTTATSSIGSATKKRPTSRKARPCVHACSGSQIMSGEIQKTVATPRPVPARRGGNRPPTAHSSRVARGPGRARPARGRGRERRGRSATISRREPSAGAPSPARTPTSRARHPRPTAGGAARCSRSAHAGRRTT